MTISLLRETLTQYITLIEGESGVVLRRPLCEDTDKIPDGRTSILHLSGLQYRISFMPLWSGKKKEAIWIKQEPILFLMPHFCAIPVTIRTAPLKDKT